MTVAFVFMPIALLGTAAVGFPETGALEAESLPGRAEFDSVIEGGKLLSVFGLFDLGIEMVDAEFGDVGEGLAQFFTEHRLSYGLHVPVEAESLEVTRLDPIDAGRAVVHLEQHTADGARIFDSELTVVIWNDGLVESINGPVRGFVPPSRTERAVHEVLGAARAIPDFAAPTAEDLMSSVYRAGAYRWADEDAIAAERGFDPEAAAYVWDVSSSDRIERIRLRDDDLSVISRRELLDPIDVDSTRCSIRHYNWPRDANLHVTQFGNNNQANGTMYGADTWCTGDYYTPPWGPDWHLRLETAGYPHRLGRIQDDDASQVWVDDPNFTATPTFSQSTTSALEQQTAFSEAYAMRLGVWRNCWSQFEQDDQDNVQITLDTSGTTGFLGLNTDIYINSSDTNARLANTVRHEYGHYVVMTYGDVSDNCSATDQGDAIDETIADAFAMIAIRDDSNLLPNYNTNFALGQFGASSWVAPHTTTPGNAVVNSGACIPCTTNTQCTRNAGDTCMTWPRNFCDSHFNGLAFEQAIWELLYNRNCSTTTSPCTGTTSSCTASTTGNGNDIWCGATEDQVSDNVGRALAYAMKTLGQNVTFGQIITAMRSQWVVDTGTNAANRARAVFTHHGM